MHEHARACSMHHRADAATSAALGTDSPASTGSTRCSVLQAVDLIVEGEGRRLRRGHMSAAGFMLLWGNGYWRPMQPTTSSF